MCPSKCCRWCASHFHVHVRNGNKRGFWDWFYFRGWRLKVYEALYGFLFMNIITLDLRWDAFLYIVIQTEFVYICLLLYATVFVVVIVFVSLSKWCEAFLCTCCAFVCWIETWSNAISTLTFNLNAKEEAGERKSIKWNIDEFAIWVSNLQLNHCDYYQPQIYYVSVKYTDFLVSKNHQNQPKCEIFIQRTVCYLIPHTNTH